MVTQAHAYTHMYGLLLLETPGIKKPAHQVCLGGLTSSI